MKNIQISGLLVCLCLSMQSCLFSEKDVFDDSSAQRAMASVNECHDVLKSAPNGWALKYYTGAEGEYGGYTIYAKFDGENVTLATEVETKSYAVGENSVSQYKVSSFQGTQLSFDSYNEIIHQFCEPNSFFDPGYSGDYEFIFRSASKDKIVLTGKKHGVTLEMTPLPADWNWEEELTKIAVLADDASFSTFKLVIGSEEITKMGMSERAFTISKTDVSGQVTTELYPFIYTTDGVEMFEPLTINGTAMTHFKWDSETMVYTCTDKGVDAQIVFYTPDGYLQYIGDYTLKAGANNIACKLEQKRLGKTYSLKLVVGEDRTPLEFVFDYNLDTECIDLMSQKVGTYNGFDLMFYPGHGQNFYTGAGSGFTGKVTAASPLTISFTYNGSDSIIDSIFVLYNDNGWGLFTSIVNPVLIKKAN